jgi:hypothetical protein
MLKTAKRASLIDNLHGLRGLSTMLVFLSHCIEALDMPLKPDGLRILDQVKRDPFHHKRIPEAGDCLKTSDRGRSKRAAAGQAMSLKTIAAANAGADWSITAMVSSEKAKTLHLVFSSSGRLMRILGSVVVWLGHGTLRRLLPRDDVALSSPRPIVSTTCEPMQFIENKTFDELKIGDLAEITRTLHRQDIELFAVMSGDVNGAPSQVIMNDTWAVREPD